VRPAIDSQTVTFRVPDSARNLASVNLLQEVSRPRDGPPFIREQGTWTLCFPRPDADRLEYKLKLVRRSGDIQAMCDPGNPLRAPGPFGDKSVVEWPEYRPPAWLDDSADGGITKEILVTSRTLEVEFEVRIWTPAGHESSEPLPLLVVHDGFEYADHCRLLGFLGACVRDRRLPPHRAALLAPVDRDLTYSASASYSHALVHEILTALRHEARSPRGRRMRVGMGASLGALAMLHAHRKNPAGFGGLFLQSGSYFRPSFDPQESGFIKFERISRFMGEVLTKADWAHVIPVAMTCGKAEENLLNNRSTRDALLCQGYEVRLHETRDAHNWVSWRDAFDPHLTDLLNRLWG
jgi:enterochelin esterase-like enzyme